MGSRLDLQTLLETILGSNKVHFQPPSNFQLSYPCIIYSRTDILANHGDNRPYKLEKEYTVTIITTDVDSDIPDKFAQVPRTSFDRHYKASNLYHDVFKIIY